jgi:ABC-type multidrug transport system fused ATPase/permease subunit
MGILWGYLSRHPWHLLACLAGLSVALALELLLPQLVGKSLNDLLQGPPASGILTCAWLAALYLFLAAAREGAVAWTGLAQTRWANDVIGDVRRDLYRAIQRKAFASARIPPPGDLFSRATSDLKNLEEFLALAPGTLLDTLVYFCSSVVIVTFVNLFLGFISLLILCTSTWLIIQQSLALYQHWQIVRLRYASTVAVVQENLAALRLVRAFSREATERRRLLAHQKACLEALLQGVTFWATRLPAAQLLFLLSFPLVLWVGAQLVSQGALLLGDLVKVLIYLTAMGHRLCGLTNLSNLWQNARASGERVAELLREAEPQSSGRRPVPSGAGPIVFDRVSLTKNQRRILQEVCLEIPPGAVVVVTGPTGAGKSTLLGLLPRFYDPSWGRILWSGIDIREMELRSLRRSVVYVFQEPLLFQGTIRENIAYGFPHATREEIHKAAWLACADDFIEVLPKGYETVLGEQGTCISGGQKQRLALARALLLRPRILILDGSTSNLDVETEARLWDRLTTALDPKPTILWVTQRLSLMKRADRVLLLEGGRVLQEGTHEDLMAQTGPYREIHLAQRSGAFLAAA